jgi:enoyl-CoA hydratase/carnithine racemase
MQTVYSSVTDNVATIKISRGKVNALNTNLVKDLKFAFEAIKNDSGIKAAILTGEGKFFSFGFDIPHFLTYSKENFKNYLVTFTNFYTYLFNFPKPVIAALNGHTIAGGCMLALACDERIMVKERGKISLNEIGFGSSVFAGSVEMLRFCVGDKIAQEILYSGNMYSANEAKEIGLIDSVTSVKFLMEDAFKQANLLAEKHQPAFAGIKDLLRGPIVDKMVSFESQSINVFVEIWYSESTWKNLKQITIK